MKKFIIVKTGREVKVGDMVVTTFLNKIPVFGMIETSKVMTLTESLLQEAIKKGEIKVIEGEDDITNKEYLDTLRKTVINTLKLKTGWNDKELTKVLDTLENTNPWAAVQLVLKEIAIELDKKYKDNINESEHIYAISPQDGKIHEINKENIKNYKTFPAFRNVKDATIAGYLIKETLNQFF